MTTLRALVAATAAAALLTGCMHRHTEYEATGDVTIDSLSATRTALLRVENNYVSDVRVYTVIAKQQNYVGKAKPGETRTVVLDPNLFPTDAISFEARAADGSVRRTVGPYKVNKGETVDLVVTPGLDAVRATIHKSTP